jgi:type II secretory pathway pseudopilin PulG
LQKKTSALIANGFSLVELLLYSAISLMLIGAVGSIAVSETTSSIKTYVLVALRNQIASVTFLLEGEIGEGESISVCSAPCTVNIGTATLSVPYSLVITHPYAVTGAGRSTATISYYGKTNDPNLYRFGPPFTTATTSVDPVSGNLGFGSGALNTGAASAETVASPNTSLSSMSIDNDERRTLTYSITITSGTTDRSSAWASSLTSTGLKARTRVGF